MGDLRTSHILSFARERGYDDADLIALSHHRASANDSMRIDALAYRLGMDSGQVTQAIRVHAGLEVPGADGSTSKCREVCGE